MAKTKDRNTASNHDAGRTDRYHRRERIAAASVIGEERLLKAALTLVRDHPRLIETFVAIGKLDSSALEAFAESNALLAALCRARAKDLDQRERDRRSAARREPFGKGLGELAAKIGAPAAAARYGVILSTAQLALRMFNMRERLYQRRSRDIKIMRLSAKGWSDQRIAEKIGVAPRTVSRVIRMMLNGTSGVPLLTEDAPDVSPS